MDNKFNGDKVDIEQLLKSGQAVEIVPQGVSMRPLFEGGRDKVTLVAVGEKRLKSGDVVIFRRPGTGQLILHRIYRVKPEGLYIIGDNEQLVEGPLNPDVVFGVMTSFVRKGKYHTTSNVWYRLVFGMWRVFTPVRGKIVKVYHKIRGIKD